MVVVVQKTACTDQCDGLGHTSYHTRNTRPPEIPKSRSKHAKTCKKVQSTGHLRSLPRFRRRRARWRRSGRAERFGLERREEVRPQWRISGDQDTPAKR